MIRYPVVRHPDGLDTTVLGLRFRLRSHHFNKGKMQLTCTASVSDMRIDSSTSQNITNSDAVDHPKQRSLESRPVTPLNSGIRRSRDFFFIYFLMFHGCI